MAQKPLDSSHDTTADDSDDLQPKYTHCVSIFQKSMETVALYDLMYMLLLHLSELKYVFIHLKIIIY